jgi:predicted phage terminase large subunit-like protein
VLAATRAAQSNLIPFAQLTKKDYEAAAHHYLTASYLERVEAGEIRRLMIFEPPRHGKSELTSRRFPAWYLGRNPNKFVIATSYNADLAKAFGRDVRNLVADPVYQAIFPGTSLRQDSKAADRWNTTGGGAYLAAGIGTGITGHGLHLGLIDDPFKDHKEAESKNIRDGVWDWYKSTFYTRLMPNAAIVLNVTRWHEDDLAGRLLKEQARGGDIWTVIILPAIAEGPDELGREEGEALWPAWYPLSTLERIREVIGSYEWNALYQQRPVAQEGNIFKKSWWRYYREIPDFNMTIQSWDTGFKTGEDNDYSVNTTWGSTEPNFFLLDRFKDKLEFPELKRAVIASAVQFKPDAILVEDKASGQSLVQELQRETHLPILAIKVDRDKVARAHAVTPLIEGGRVYLPEWATWVDDYVTCMGAFPKGPDDDDIDSTTQALEYLKTSTYGHMSAEDVDKLMLQYGRRG